jgi:hypothetical protein
MQQFLAGLIGTIMIAGVALFLNWVRKKHKKISGGIVGEAILTGSVIMMVLAGTEMVGAGPGHLIHTVITWLEGFAGVTVALGFIAIGALFMLGAIIIAIVTKASEAVLGTAFLFPLMCAMFTTGLFADILVKLEIPAGHITASIMQGLGV